MKTKVKTYTVLLLYPDYMTDSRSETYACHVLAGDPVEAVSKAREYAVSANDMEPEELDDFAVIAVYEGHRTNLIPKEET